MRLLTLLLMLYTAPLAADETGFTSKGAKDAQKSYDRDVEKARKTYEDAVEKARKDYEISVASAQKTYTDTLVDVAKSTAQKGDLDEVTRINAEVKRIEALVPGATLDPVEAARKKVAGTRWTWGTNVVDLAPNGDAWTTPGNEHGKWAMVSPTECVVKVTPKALWVFQFDDDFRSMSPIYNRAGTVSEKERRVR